ncbi:hypothetical protein JOD43_003913 [Pullulanibacillus pueri]|uniref:Uncharacterized protein n=1 Tax=Pullulanibacillus pueri TaxID=1437324 RepID=A0A8J2ZYE7_9BACL|nr:hypothetical protein [Pullulanibacillus pueri]MBM7683733.1 hypothetical protein [Pullulanibacillus pueri]GGH85129.1 hypothetical protein GCM10007096_29800 [Pullulanibacillus pueri]
MREGVAAMDARDFDELIATATRVKTEAERRGNEWLARQCQREIEWATEKKAAATAN